MASEPMAQENTADAAKRLFASVMEPGEDIKILVGQRVVLNESHVGKERDRLEPETLNQLSKSVLTVDEQRVDIPLAPKGDPKAAEFEVLAISKDERGQTSTRKLFREEKGPDRPISINLVGDLLADLVVEAEVEGTQNGFATYVIAHQRVDRGNNPFSPDLENYTEDIKKSPYFADSISEAFKDGFEQGQKNGQETHPDINAVRLDTQVSDIPLSTTASAASNNGTLEDELVGSKESKLTQEYEDSFEEGTTYNSLEEWESEVEAESEWPREIIERMEEEADVGEVIADEQPPPSDATLAQQYWAADIDEWLSDQSEEILQQPDMGDTFETDNVPAKSAALDNNQPISDQATNSDPISMSDAAVETQEEIVINQPDLSDTEEGLEKWATQETTTSVDAEQPGVEEDLNALNEHLPEETDTPLEAERNIKEPSLADTLSLDRDEAQEPQADSVSSGNTIAALFQSIEQLPEGSSARNIAENLATELQAHASEIKAREEKAQNRKNWLEEGGSAIKASGKAIQRTVVQAKSSIQAGSVKDAAVGIALKSVGAIADMSSKGLKAAGQYLKNRAQKVEEYGMAKAAVTIHRKGHSRTGEDSFTKDGYTVQKQGNAYSVLDTKNRAVMTFETNRKGQPINVTQTDAAQKEDKWAVGRIAKSSVILGSSEKEKAYEEKLRAIATVASDLLGESHEADGKNFRVSREDGGIAVSTKTFPSRYAQINALGEVESDLTRDDLNQLGRSLTIAVDYATEEAYKTKDKVEITV